MAEAQQIRFAGEETTVEEKLKSLSEAHENYEELGHYEESQEFIRAYSRASSPYVTVWP